VELSRAQSRATLDRIGAVLSMTCVLHCLFTPLLVASVSLGAVGWMASEGMEFALLLSAMILAAVVLVWGWHSHRRLGSLGLFAFALVLIGAGRSLAPETAEMPMVVAGGLAIALAHIVNSRLCRRCTECQAVAEANHPPGSSSIAMQRDRRSDDTPACPRPESTRSHQPFVNIETS
jgi:MerC mercury resistance protein